MRVGILQAGHFRLLTLSRRAIAWRLVFLALETSLEDAMVALVLPEFGIYVLADGDVLKGNLFANLLTAVGKIGAVFSAFVMHKYWDPENQQAYKMLFFFCLLTAAATFLIPAAFFMSTQNELWTYILIFLASFMFFLFATVPKIGFATLLQSLASSEDASGSIFGFAASFITVTDAVILLILSELFGIYRHNLNTIFWICTACFGCVGVIEGLFGPSLFLPKDEKDTQDDQRPLLTEASPTLN